MSSPRSRRELGGCREQEDAQSCQELTQKPPKAVGSRQEPPGAVGSRQERAVRSRREPSGAAREPLGAVRSSPRSRR